MLAIFDPIAWEINGLIAQGLRIETIGMKKIRWAGAILSDASQMKSPANEGGAKVALPSIGAATQ